MLSKFFYRDSRLLHIGILFIRFGLGVAMTLHGFPKIAGGPERWESLGSAMQYLGIEFGYAFWGFMAGAAEFVCGLLLMAGIFLSPALLLLIFVMFVATLKNFVTGSGYLDYGHSLEIMIVFIGLFISGPGRFSLDEMFFSNMLKREAASNDSIENEESE